MVEVKIDLSVENVSIEDEDSKVEYSEAPDELPVEDMEVWLEVLYANEKYDDEDVDVEVNIS